MFGTARDTETRLYRFSLPYLGLLFLVTGCVTFPKADSSAENLANLMSQTNQPVEVVEVSVFDRWKDKHEEKPLTDMANVFMQSGKHDRAEILFRMALEHEDDYTAAQIGLARIYMLRKEPEKALGHIDQVRRKDRKLPEVCNERASALAQLNRHDEALDAIDRALAADPENQRYLSNRAAILAMAERYPEALAAYRACLSDADAHFKIAGVLFSHGHPNESIDQLRFALACDANHEDSGRMLQFLTHQATAQAQLPREATSTDPRVAGSTCVEREAR